jgi:hypothetical protein
VAHPQPRPPWQPARGPPPLGPLARHGPAPPNPSRVGVPATAATLRVGARAEALAHAVRPAAGPACQWRPALCSSSSQEQPPLWRPCRAPAELQIPCPTSLPHASSLRAITSRLPSAPSSCHWRLAALSTPSAGGRVAHVVRLHPPMVSPSPLSIPSSSPLVCARCGDRLPWPGLGRAGLATPARSPRVPRAPVARSVVATVLSHRCRTSSSVRGRGRGQASTAEPIPRSACPCSALCEFQSAQPGRRARCRHSPRSEQPATLAVGLPHSSNLVPPSDSPCTNPDQPLRGGRHVLARQDGHHASTPAHGSPHDTIRRTARG